MGRPRTVMPWTSSPVVYFLMAVQSESLILGERYGRIDSPPYGWPKVAILSSIQRQSSWGITTLASS
eukprot:10020643-Ditylum_brightwellii.AAC.1